jgi:hypothetical protein
MRIYGPTGLAATTPAAALRRPTAGTFAVSEGDSSQAAVGASALRTVGGIDALIALQGIEDPTERRRHALKRGRHALDALDELKIGLLGGILSPATLTKLKAAAGYLKDASGDAGLDTVLAEIELRVEVEIAKLMPR